jgi:hypothetical protein
MRFKMRARSGDYLMRCSAFEMMRAMFSTCLGSLNGTKARMIVTDVPAPGGQGFLVLWKGQQGKIIAAGAAVQR